MAGARQQACDLATPAAVWWMPCPAPLTLCLLPTCLPATALRDTLVATARWAAGQDSESQGLQEAWEDHGFFYAVQAA